MDIRKEIEFKNHLYAYSMDIADNEWEQAMDISNDDRDECRTELARILPVEINALAIRRVER